MPEPTPALNAALAKVQAKLPKLERDRKVEVETKKGEPYSYSYATLGHLSEVALPLLAEHGLAFTAMPGLGSDGKMCVAYSLLHESGEERSGEFPISGEGGIQMIGGRITYARRYCLAAVTGIAADEDDESRLADEAPRTAQRRPRQQAETDGNSTAQRARPATRPPLPGEQEQQPDPVTSQQITKIQATFSSIGWTDRDDKLRAASTIVGRPLGSAKDLTKTEASTVIEALSTVEGEPDPSEALAALLTQIREREGGA